MSDSEEESSSSSDSHVSAVSDRPLKKRKLEEFNNATECIFETEPFAQGKFRFVHRGKYTEGERAGDPCVVKMFKTGSVFEESFYDTDIAVVEKAASLIIAFNDSQAKVVQKHVYLNRPELWEQGNEGDGAGQKLLIEPMIEGQYHSFNSNTGYVGDGFDVMQALSHFSYHVTDGELLLCDLQGGITTTSYILTDPVILSRAKKYGPTDLGSKGIRNFMARHKCTPYCARHWKRPLKAAPNLPVYKGTTFASKGTNALMTRGTSATHMLTKAVTQTRAVTAVSQSKAATH